jgi:NAD(P)-dependent dehydrogenase (short-subunit alcohol dehydrogenase family)
MMPPERPAAAPSGPVPPPTRGLVVIGPGGAFGGQLLARFGREGFRVGVIARSVDTLARLTGELADAGLTMRGAVADVTDPEGLTAAVGGLAADLGGLTVLVYNAKLSIRGTAFTTPADALNQALAVNVTGALTAVQAATPLLGDRPGATIMVTVAGERTEPPGGRFALAAGKAGLAALAGAVGPALADHGVRMRTVVLDARVAPAGPLRPEIVAEHFWRAYAAPRGEVFRLAGPGPRQVAETLPLEV